MSPVQAWNEGLVLGLGANTVDSCGGQPKPQDGPMLILVNKTALRAGDTVVYFQDYQDTTGAPFDKDALTPVNPGWGLGPPPPALAPGAMFSQNAGVGDECEQSDPPGQPILYETHCRAAATALGKEFKMAWSFEHEGVGTYAGGCIMYDGPSDAGQPGVYLNTKGLDAGQPGTAHFHKICVFYNDGGPPQDPDGAESATTAPPPPQGQQPQQPQPEQPQGNTNTGAHTHTDANFGFWYNENLKPKKIDVQIQI